MSLGGEDYRRKNKYIDVMKLMEGIVKWQVGEWWNMHTQQVGPDTMNYIGAERYYELNQRDSPIKMKGKNGYNQGGSSSHDIGRAKAAPSSANTPQSWTHRLRGRYHNCRSILGDPGV